jgi:hypothetical protein
MVSDTLSMPPGKGGFKKLSLYMDLYSQCLWTRKLKTAATGKTTVAGMDNISSTFTAPETLMVDGGPEFDNNEVRSWCDNKGTTLHIVPAYSPWVNGLLEGTNGKLLDRLKRMCAPDLGEDDYAAMGWDNLPTTWPDHLDAAVEVLNNRILPNLRYSPNELLLGLIINRNCTPVDQATAELTEESVALQMAYVDQQRLDGYTHTWLIMHTNGKQSSTPQYRPEHHVKLYSRPIGSYRFIEAIWTTHSSPYARLSRSGLLRDILSVGAEIHTSSKLWKDYPLAGDSARGYGDSYPERGPHSQRRKMLWRKSWVLQRR